LNLAQWQMQAPMRNKRYRLANAGEAVVDYLTWKEIEDGAATRTLDQYERDLARLCLAHPAVPAERLTADHYRSVIAAFPAGSRKRATAVFRDFSRWLYQEGRSVEDAMGRVRYPRAKRQAVVDVFSDNECTRLAQQPDRDRPLVRLLLEAGLRKAEARQLRLRHLDVEQCRLRNIEGKGRKDRLIPSRPTSSKRFSASPSAGASGPETTLVCDQGQPIRRSLPPPRAPNRRSHLRPLVARLLRAGRRLLPQSPRLPPHLRHPLA
jgi:site-specific recombinase XerC